MPMPPPLDDTMSRSPVLSVVIPAFNREGLVLRAVRSVLADPSPDIEVVVVDDGSSDRTAEVVAGVSDPRLRLIRHPQNRGRCPARNTGAMAAEGEWLVFLDSDDELVPGGLELIRRRAAEAPAAVGKLLFMCRDDVGLTSPDPPLDGRQIDYEGYLRWLEETSGGRAEALPCTRRVAFLECPYPDGRHWQEGIHELDFARRWRLQLCPEVVRYYHLDATNRVMAPDRARLLAQAEDFAAHAEAVLSRHGPALSRVAPARWLISARQAALFRFLNGDRIGGLRHSLRLMARHPANIRVWLVLAAGLLGPGPLAAIVTRNQPAKPA
jgi:glycosyltransferase involved in cell wall biosynthesis